MNARARFWTTLIMLAIFLSGLIAYRLLPVSTATVATILCGAASNVPGEKTST